MNSLNEKNLIHALDLLADCEREISNQLIKASSKRLLALMQYYLEAGGSWSLAKLAIYAGLAMDLPPNDCIANAKQKSDSLFALPAASGDALSSMCHTLGQALCVHKTTVCNSL